MSRKKKAGRLVGVVVGPSDGHRRITNSEDFTVVGGSKEAHECGVENAVKFGEELSKRGKTVSELSRREFTEIVDKVLK